MTSLSLADYERQVFQVPFHKRHRSSLVICGLIAYALFCVLYFDFLGSFARFDRELFRKSMLDFYSYVEEVRVNHKRLDRTKIRVDWSEREGDVIRATLLRSYGVEIDAGVVKVTGPKKLDLKFFTDDQNKLQVERNFKPDADTAKVNGHGFLYREKYSGDGSTLLNAKMTFNNGAEIYVTKSQVKLVNRLWGWEYFWFGDGHELTNMTWGQYWSFLFSSEKREIETYIRDERGLRKLYEREVGPWRYAYHSFMTNPDWKHGQIFFYTGQSLAMAYCGVLLAALLALLVAFPAAANISNRFVSFTVKRFLDVIRAIDHLFWALIFIRGGFGQGMLSGIASLMVVETGTLGKLMSEAIENADGKQAEGVRSTGAAELSVRRFGIIPQILPVFISQVLYFFESSVRSATVIGAVVGAGLGLKILTDRANGTDWEDIAYVALIIIVMVIIIDNFTNWIRQRLIGKSSH